ncbi:MAG: hypothetical protein ABMA02_06675 [Saprospiraceae bacterium]
MKQYLLLFLPFFAATAFSQTAPDVLKFSYLNPGGTARFVGAGGAFGALGAEFGGLSQNPAGLAMYRTNELVVTPGLRFANTDATLKGNNNLTFDESKTHFRFDNLGIVFNTTPVSGKWKTFNVGIGYNQQANYNQGIYYAGNAAGTILNNWFSNARSVLAVGGTTNDFDEFTGKLAYQAEAIYGNTAANLTYDFANDPNAVVEHSQSITQSGTYNEMVLSLAGNYDEKLLVGATVGIPFLRYRISTEYREKDVNNSVDAFENLAYSEFLNTDGYGVNIKFGVVYRASQAIRIGAHIHSPTWMSLTDDYSTSLTYVYNPGNPTPVTTTKNSGSFPFDYKLTTPWRAGVSGAVLLQKHGFLSAEVEWVDYSANAYNFTADVANTENQLAERQVNGDIQRLFEPRMNIRLGGELALSEFRLRGGVNLLGKPYATDDGFNTGFTAGAGVRGESFFLDFGVRLGSGTGSVIPYADGPEADTKNNVTDVLMTIGFKF